MHLKGLHSLFECDFAAIMCPANSIDVINTLESQHKKETNATPSSSTFLVFVDILLNCKLAKPWWDHRKQGRQDRQENLQEEVNMWRWPKR